MKNVTISSEICVTMIMWRCHGLDDMFILIRTMKAIGKGLI